MPNGGGNVRGGSPAAMECHHRGGGRQGRGVAPLGSAQQGQHDKVAATPKEGRGALAWWLTRRGGSSAMRPRHGDSLVDKVRHRWVWVLL
jgi:hypothetical protein